MEPGHEDREDRFPGHSGDGAGRAAMEPGHEDREDRFPGHSGDGAGRAAMEPGHEDREDLGRDDRRHECCVAAMEPGHEDREDPIADFVTAQQTRPQWSPVTKTGKTHRAPSGSRPCASCRNGARSRRPGRLSSAPVSTFLVWAAMEPGHEDREDRGPSRTSWLPPACRNGARSRRPGRLPATFAAANATKPQWSPVTKTGKTVPALTEAPTW